MTHPSLRLTPSNSPFFRNTTPRSPTKPRSEEAGLRLRKVIGTTTSNANGFDCLPAKRQFAYCAGSAAVVATVDEDLNVSQSFFRARPASGNGTRDGGFPVTPTPNEARSRALGHVREHTIGGSPLGASTRDWSESPAGKTATAKDRVKAATSVALSPNGKWVALGETGYRPRVVLFSNTTDSSESPICALAEHTFGVQALRFSPDSRYLASLGTVNDGFLYIWSMDDRTGGASLHSSNKCTVMINDMLWVGKNLLTIGLRFVKVWRATEDSLVDNRPSDATGSLGTPKSKTTEFGKSILSPRQKVLAGKNSLLGELLDCNFVCAVPLDNDAAFLCADTGEVAMLSDITKTQSLRTVAHVNFAISAGRVDGSDLLHVLGASGQCEQFSVAELIESAPTIGKSDRRQTVSPKKLSSSQTPVVTGTCALADLVIEMDSTRTITLAKPAEKTEHGEDAESHLLLAHNDAVSGVGAMSSRLLPGAAFFTYAGNGLIRLWEFEGSSVPSTLTVPIESSADMYDQANELRCAAHLVADDKEYIVAGDKYGTLSVMDLRTGDIAFQTRAHSAEIADVVAFDRSGLPILATCSRDRTVQLFAWTHGQLDLIQTLDEHAAAVNGLLVASNGERLLSHSQDRTVIVREAMLRDENDPASVVFVMTRSLALKSSPTAICNTAHEDEILVASMDRCIGVHNVKTGQAGFNFKCSDTEGGEAVAMAKIAYEASLNGNPAIIGISSSDKSVRLYSEYGSLIARDWGHTEGITALAVLHPGKTAESSVSDSVRVVTAAADSTVFVWDTMPPAPSSNDPTTDANGTPNATLHASPSPLRPPLRKVLSFSELSRFKREKSADDGNRSPTMNLRQRSPQRLNKKPSKMSLAQAPNLEPAFRGEHARRRSLRKRSPSPPSPRNRKEGTASRKPSLGTSMRSRSSENLRDGLASPTSVHTGFGSLTASTESVCRTLRVYRKKLSGVSTVDHMAPDILRELETELRLLGDVLSEKMPGRRVDEEVMAKALEQASEKLVSRLDERIKERVEDEMRKSTSDSIPSTTREASETDVEAVTGAMESVALENSRSE